MLLSLKYLIHHHLLYHQTSSWKVHSFSHQEVPQTTFPTTWSFYHDNVLCNFYVMLSLCLVSVPWLTDKPVLYWTIQGPSPHSLEEQLSHQRTDSKVLWRQSPTPLLGYWCLATCLRKQAAKTQVSPSSWGGSLHCPCEKVLINLISWVQSAQTAFVSWEVIHAKLPHFSGSLSSSLPLCWSFGKGIIFSQAVHYCEQEEEGQEQQPQFDKWPLVTD